MSRDLKFIGRLISAAVIALFILTLIFIGIFWNKLWNRDSIENTAISNGKSSPDTLYNDNNKNESSRPPAIATEQLRKYLEQLQKAAFHKNKATVERSPLYEGDIVLQPSQAKRLLQQMTSQTSKSKSRRKRKLTEPTVMRWTLPIPYAFDLSQDGQQRDRIRKAIAYWEEKTCIRFWDITDQKHLHRNNSKLLFVGGHGCWSYVGFTKQINQKIAIGSTCTTNGTIAHELGHAVGFWHEQSRPDRDKYIKVLYDNVSSGKQYNFHKRSWGEILTMSIPYDPGSDMHYGAKFYAKDKNKTFTTVATVDPLLSRVIGQRQKLSFFDVKLANSAYCLDRCSSQLPELCRRQGYQDPLACHKCRCPEGFTGTYCERVATGTSQCHSGLITQQKTGVLFSPGYPRQHYEINTECNWLIRAASGYHILLKFSDLENFGIAGHDEVCKDFVEIRYNSSLALTGARFCGVHRNNKGFRDLVIRSHSREMLVLFRSYPESRICGDKKHPWKCVLAYTGFKLKYWWESCGGCHYSKEGKFIQPACYRQYRQSCVRRWYVTEDRWCTRVVRGWWGSIQRVKYRCGTQKIQKTRVGQCSREEAYCCNPEDWMLIYRDGRPFCKIVYPIVPKTTTYPPTTPTTTSNLGVVNCSAACGGGFITRKWYKHTIVTSAVCNTHPCFRQHCEYRVSCAYYGGYRYHTCRRNETCYQCNWPVFVPKQQFPMHFLPVRQCTQSALKQRTFKNG